MVKSGKSRGSKGSLDRFKDRAEDGRPKVVRVPYNIPRLLAGSGSRKRKAAMLIGKAGLWGYLPELLTMCFDENEDVGEAALKVAEKHIKDWYNKVR